MTNFSYTGNELDVFKFAKNWKSYYLTFLKKYLKVTNVIEVGAGIGEMTSVLYPYANNAKWVCLEPDKKNIKYAETNLNENFKNNNLNFAHSTFEDFKTTKQDCDLVLFIDSLEHIEDDQQMFDKALSITKTGGHVAIIVPAHNFLFNEFDAKIGHFRRYNKKMLTKLVHNQGTIVVSKYIDSVGFFLSLANKYLLKESDPKLSQIIFWDRVVVPLSKIVDKILFHSFGKNIVFIVRK